ncbi:hypothetical protein HK105_201806 [Polyrhizophydium stewartii]|uniref:Chitin-binding type-1 domain-containing protein n=1 Tax=Polyrhizophydium stewartii TaxID=2732419 RepID=A0ABR4NG28_9FUNG
MKTGDAQIARLRANEARMAKIVDFFNAETDKGKFLSQSARVVAGNERLSFAPATEGDAAKRSSAIADVVHLTSYIVCTYPAADSKINLSWCGSTDAHCGANCQSPFGRCNGITPSPSPSPSPSPTPAADVHLTSYIVCTYPAADSKINLSWCGSTDAHCGANCQSPFGRCNGITPSPSPSPSPSPTPAADVRCGAAAGGAKCPNDLCCSFASYCGSTDAHCGANCQSPFGRCNGVAPSPSPSPPATPLPPPTSPRPDNRCGRNFNGATCDSSQCCSSIGYCGKTSDHCDIGCQALYGKCSPPPTAGYALPPAFSTSNFPGLAPSTAACKTPAKRVEFRTMTKTQRDNYVKAVKCLRTQPSKFPASLGTKTAHDDLVYVHLLAGEFAHLTAQLLPWHRVFVLNFESLLRNVCGYTDPLPYWDVSKDSQAPEKSAVWATDFMGGNGDPSTGCLKTGPFVGMTVNVPTPHCIKRGFYTDPQYGSMLGAQYSPDEVNYILTSNSDYENFRPNFEDTIHNSVHSGVGGDMNEPTMSPNDPIFFLHHANVDRLWWAWQNVNDKSFNQYGGMRSATLDSASLTDHVFMWGLGQDFLVKDVLNTVGGGRFCYTYDSSPVAALKSDGFAKIDLNETPLPRGSPVVNASIVPLAGASTSVAVQPLNGTASPGALDRSDKHHLRHHLPVSEKMLRKMRYTDKDIARVRANEAKLNKVVDFLNQQTDKGRFLSQAALVITESDRVSFKAPSAADVAKGEAASIAIVNEAIAAVGRL